MIQTRGLCISAAVLYQLSYEENPCTGGRLFFGLFRNCFNCDSLQWSHIHFICIPAVHIISFCVSFLSRVDELNKLAPPSIWVFIAQLVEHCSVNAEATGSNPVEALKNFFSGYFTIAWSRIHFII